MGSGNSKKTGNSKSAKEDPLYKQEFNTENLRKGPRKKSIAAPEKRNVYIKGQPNKSRTTYEAKLAEKMDHNDSYGFNITDNHNGNLQPLVMLSFF